MQISDYIDEFCKPKWLWKKWRLHCTQWYPINQRIYNSALGPHTCFHLERIARLEWRVHCQHGSSSSKSLRVWNDRFYAVAETTLPCHHLLQLQQLSCTPHPTALNVVWHTVIQCTAEGWGSSKATQRWQKSRPACVYRVQATADRPVWPLTDHGTVYCLAGSEPTGPRSRRQPTINHWTWMTASKFVSWTDELEAPKVNNAINKGYQTDESFKYETTFQW